MVDTPKPKVRTIRGRDFRTVFANGMRIRLGDNDTAITFLIETDDENGMMVHEDQVQVMLTPKSLKVLQLVLTHGVGELEKALGAPITFAPEKQAELDKTLATVMAKKLT
jgi:hypothetical protein